MVLVFRVQMIKRIAISFLIALAAAAAISSACPSPLDRFVADGEFCAYMVSPPEGVADVFLARYQAEVQSVIAFLRQADRSMSETQALFAIRAACDTALNGQ